MLCEQRIEKERKKDVWCNEKVAVIYASKYSLCLNNVDVREPR